MANILFLTYNSADACSFYRAGGVVKDLRRVCDHVITVAQWNRIDLNWQTLLDFDIIMMQRPFSRAAKELCIGIKSMNIPLWIDYDDNLFCVPPENRSNKIYDKPEIKSQIEEIIKMADVITVTNQDLKESLIQFNKNIEIIPNAFNDSIFRRGILRKREKLVIWRGTDTHIWDIMRYGRSISKATAEFPDYRFVYLGFNPWFLNQAANQSFIADEMDIIYYFNHVFSMAPMVMQVPIVDELFNRCKSNIAYIEGTYFGALCVVPKWWDVPGALSYDSEGSYYEALKQALSGEVDIEAQNAMAWQYIMDELTLSKVNVKRLNVINSLL